MGTPDKDEDEARRLYSDVRKRMGEAFWVDRSPDLEGIRLPDGTLAIRSEDLWFFRNPPTGELSVGRRDANGEAEFGGIDENGAVRWGEAVVVRLPPPSMN
jgi:hypothetical protein